MGTWPAHTSLLLAIFLTVSGLWNCIWSSQLCDYPRSLVWLSSNIRSCIFLTTELISRAPYKRTFSTAHSTVLFYCRPHRLHVAQPSSGLSYARIRKRLCEHTVQHVGVLVRLLGRRLPTRGAAQWFLAKPVLQHASAAAGQTLGVIQRRQVRSSYFDFVDRSLMQRV